MASTSLRSIFSDSGTDISYTLQAGDTWRNRHVLKAKSETWQNRRLMHDFLAESMCCSHIEWRNHLPLFGWFWTPWHIPYLIFFLMITRSSGLTLLRSQMLMPTTMVITLVISLLQGMPGVMMWLPSMKLRRSLIPRNRNACGCWLLAWSLEANIICHTLGLWIGFRLLGRSKCITDGTFDDRQQIFQAFLNL